jgi:hypothetical protein
MVYPENGFLSSGLKFGASEIAAAHGIDIRFMAIYNKYMGVGDVFRLSIREIHGR